MIHAGVTVLRSVGESNDRVLVKKPCGLMNENVHRNLLQRIHQLTLSFITQETRDTRQVDVDGQRQRHTSSMQYKVIYQKISVSVYVLFVRNSFHFD